MDITERQATEARLQELQAELLRVSRLSAAGEMASALAHELNQPLTSVASAVEAARDMLGAEPKNPETAAAARQAMNLAVEQALRSGQIIRRLRDFVARGEVDKRIEDLAPLVDEACALALAGARESGVRVTISLDPHLPPVIADRIQIQQVLVNLIRNALEALSDDTFARSGGSVRHREIVISAKSAGPIRSRSRYPIQALVWRRRLPSGCSNLLLPTSPAAWASDWRSAAL